MINDKEIIIKIIIITIAIIIYNSIWFLIQSLFSTLIVPSGHILYVLSLESK